MHFISQITLVLTLKLKFKVIVAEVLWKLNLPNSFDTDRHQRYFTEINISQRCKTLSKCAHFGF